MKRYEDFNRMFKQETSSEIQAMEIVLERVKEEFGIDGLNAESYSDVFQGVLDWLNEEVI